MRETRYARLRRLKAEEGEFSRGMYGWNHPFNVEWAKSRDISGSLSLREWCRHLENRLRDLESNRQHVADVADEPEASVAELPQADDAVADEPLVIRRQGAGRPHAK